MSPAGVLHNGRPIRVRMAPSPTGPLHIGTARTTLFNLLFARHTGGVFILRIEDTDKERSKKEFEDGLIDGLHWLGIDWDEGPLKGNGEKGDYGPYRQSERTAIYRNYLEQLLKEGNAYYCYCTKEELEAEKQAQTAAGLAPRYGGRCRDLKQPPAGKHPETIRFRVPETVIAFDDMIRGTVQFDAALFGDIVIAKDLDAALYNFAVVVDDELMKISHVIRGEEHLGNTPKQILICRALGFAEPVFAHLPLILNPDRSKMSKRYGDTALSQYVEKGYLPQAIVNFIALLGWHPKGDREVFSLGEIAEVFDIERVQKAGAVFDQDKLDWLNREYIKALDDASLAAALEPFFAKGNVSATKEQIKKIAAMERTRATTLADFAANAQSIMTMPDYDTSLLVWKDMPRGDVGPMLSMAAEKLAAIPESDFVPENLRPAVESLVGERKKGEVFWPLRVSLSGLASSPDPIDIMAVLGKEASLERIRGAIQKIAS